MLKKYKILVSLIALILLGIIVVISIWLYGIYQNKQEMLVSEVERSLFNAVQTYYSSNDQAQIERNRPFDRDGKALMQEIEKLYPDIDKEKLQGIWDSLRAERTRYFERRFKSRSTPPSFMLPHLDIDDDSRKEINKLLDKSLKSKGIAVKVRIHTLTEPTDTPQPRRRRYEITPKGDINTRPILINPDKNLLLMCKIENPFFYLLGRMSLQTIMSIALVLALITTFGYLLMTINKQNKQALLRKSFVNNMTHELKTPVATVMAAIEAVQRYGARDDKVKMAKYLDISHRELEHLSKLIERVLQLDMDGVSGLVLDKVDFDLNELLQECIETAKLSCQKPIEIDFSTNEASINYMGDRSHIKNVFTNLLDNAIKYSNEKAHILVRTDISEKDINITIQDHGQGIDEKYLNDIFDMFFRVPLGHLHPVKGFGLGLSYVKLIIEKHGGRVSVQSKPEEGSTFKVTLPY